MASCDRHTKNGDKFQPTEKRNKKKGIKIGAAAALTRAVGGLRGGRVKIRRKETSTYHIDTS